MNNNRRVVITGMGAITPLGNDVETFWTNLKNGVSGIGGLKTLEDQYTILLSKGPSRVSAFTIPMLISNMASGLISMEFGMRGPNMCIVTACATSNNAIGESWRM
ncbi:MAG: hypothetical protein DME45_10725, partial [Verrucomicrobia bacterium]